MPYPRKDQLEWLPGHYYHIFNRGARQLSIFREPTNYVYILRKMRKYLPLFKLSIIAYCLLPTHYHFLIRQDGETPTGKLPQRVFNSYSKAYNIRYEHSGTLFQGRFRAIHVTENDYLLHLCRYIHANPVKHGIVSRLEDWEYSNYPEWIGLRNGKLVDHTFIAEFFGDKKDYRAFVLDYLRSRNLPDGLSYLGDLDS